MSMQEYECAIDEWDAVRCRSLLRTTDSLL